MNTGCSSLHATHHEAKTLTSETSPRRSSLDKPRVPPLTGGRLNCGTALPIRADGIVPGSRDIPHASATTRPKKTMRGTRVATRRVRCRTSPATALLVVRIGSTLMTFRSLKFASPEDVWDGPDEVRPPRVQSCCGFGGPRQSADHVETHRAQHHGRPRHLFDSEDLGGTWFISDFVDREWPSLSACHPRRAQRHSGERNADDVGLFGKELVESRDGHVAFDRISADDHYVTSLEFFRNVQLLPETGKVLIGINRNLKAVAAQVFGVFQAAIAVWIPVERCCGLILGAKRYGQRRQRKHCQQHLSASHVVVSRFAW